MQRTIIFIKGLSFGDGSLQNQNRLWIQFWPYLLGNKCYKLTVSCLSAADCSAPKVDRPLRWISCSHFGDKLLVCVLPSDRRDWSWKTFLLFQFQHLLTDTSHHDDRFSKHTTDFPSCQVFHRMEHVSATRNWREAGVTLRRSWASDFLRIWHLARAHVLSQPSGIWILFLKIWCFQINKDQCRERKNISRL